jgi:hypothetical protein
MTPEEKRKMKRRFFVAGGLLSALPFGLLTLANMKEKGLWKGLTGKLGPIVGRDVSEGGMKTASMNLPGLEKLALGVYEPGFEYDRFDPLFWGSNLPDEAPEDARGMALALRAFAEAAKQGKHKEYYIETSDKDTRWDPEELAAKILQKSEEDPKYSLGYDDELYPSYYMLVYNETLKKLLSPLKTDEEVDWPSEYPHPMGAVQGWLEKQYGKIAKKASMNLPGLEKLASEEEDDKPKKKKKKKRWGSYPARTFKGQMALQKDVFKRNTLPIMMFGPGALIYQIMANKRRKKKKKKAPVEKQASSNELVNYTSSLDTILNDPFLPASVKTRLTDVLGGAIVRAEPESKLQGLVTTGDIIRGAVGAGLGYTTAALGGTLLGSLFAVPRPMLDNLSRTGALAGALMGSGLIT